MGGLFCLLLLLVFLFFKIGKGGGSGIPEGMSGMSEDLPSLMAYVLLCTALRKGIPPFAAATYRCSQWSPPFPHP